ncbi:MAG: cyanophycin synthetase [Caldicoprobacterales bacterium]|nr:cyanophycin synthetase [Clostridiales bacterium]
MLIYELKAYNGRNIYSHQRVIKMVVDLEEWVDIPTVEIPGFNERLMKLLPGITKHHCSLGREGGFIIRLQEGTYLAHVIEHSALEILNLIGQNVSFGRARRIRDTSSYTIVFAQMEEHAGLEAGRLAVNMVETLCKGQDFDIDFGINRIKETALRYGLGPSTQAIADAAIDRGIPVTRIGKGSIIQLGYGKYHRKMEGTLSDSISCISTDIACDKAITKELLNQSGIPVSKGIVCSTMDEAVEAAIEIGYPVALKPVYGNQGKGVSLNIESEEEIAQAFRIAAKISKNVLVEEMIQGNDYRVLVIGNQVSAVSLRIPAHIVGDGKHTIAQLVEMKNNDERRGEGHEKPLSKIKIDEISLTYLSKQGYTPDSIPKPGIRVYLKGNGNISTGGESVDVTDRIHPENQELAIRAAKIIGLDIAGVDIKCYDISNPIIYQKGAIIEVNASPGLRMHLYPSKGKPRKVGNAIIDMLFPYGIKHSIPIISVTGTNGKTTVTRMIAHIIRSQGKSVGMTTTGGIFINDKCIMKGDTTGPVSAKILLSDKTVEAAVLETARGGIIHSGLGYDLADVGVLTNISDDHLGLDGVETLEEMFHIKSLVVEAVKSNGYVVLNADDKMVVQAAKRVKANIIYFTLQEGNLIVHKHIAEGGIAVFLKDNHITLATGNGLLKSLPVTHIPATYGGKLIHNIENCLAAFSAAYALNIPIQIIENAMSYFYSDEIHNPGRFNIYNIRDFRVVVDYGHNLAGYKRVTEAITKMGASRLIGIIGTPGDRKNSVIYEIGSVSGLVFDKLIIKEDKNLRGREPGEVSNLLKEGALSVGFHKKDIMLVRNEAVALKEAIKCAKAGDLIVVFYEELDEILEIIHEESSRYNEDIISSIRRESYIG